MPRDLAHPTKPKHPAEGECVLEHLNFEQFRNPVGERGLLVQARQTAGQSQQTYRTHRFLKLLLVSKTKPSHEPRGYSIRKSCSKSAGYLLL